MDPPRATPIPWLTALANPRFWRFTTTWTWGCAVSSHRPTHPPEPLSTTITSTWPSDIAAKQALRVCAEPNVGITTETSPCSVLLGDSCKSQLIPCARMLPLVISRRLSAQNSVTRIQAVLGRRQLLLALVQKDFQTRYAGSFLGVLWTQLYPLLLLGVYFWVFSTLFKNNIAHFPLFLFVGIMLWNFFSSAILLSTNSILMNANLVKKVAFPRELVVVSVVVMALIDLAMSHVILLVAAPLAGVYPSITWLAMPFIVLLLSGFSLGFGLILGSAAVYMRDLKFFVDVGVLLLMFVSPVFYSADLVPKSSAWLMQFNPLALVITAYRNVVFQGQWPALGTWLRLLVLAVVSVVLGFEVFSRAQRGFPDAL